MKAPLFANIGCPGCGFPMAYTTDQGVLECVFESEAIDGKKCPLYGKSFKVPTIEIEPVGE